MRNSLATCVSAVIWLLLVIELSQCDGRCWFVLPVKLMEASFGIYKHNAIVDFIQGIWN